MNYNYLNMGALKMKHTLCFFSLVVFSLLVLTPILASEEASFVVDVFNDMGDCRELLSLDGKWEFKIDENNSGKDLNWHNGQGTFDATIHIPGAPQAQGIGEENEKQQNYFWKPFWVRKYFEL
ncbi:MAG TPA: hypothetical protein PLP05_06075, partial [Sedimentisphaerales bacterium]|nr:hypothetical protein [Sedimentisphaerales bacterium]